MSSRTLGLAAFVLVASTAFPHAETTQSVTFFSVTPDDGYKRADAKLTGWLTADVGLSVNVQAQNDYSAEIHQVAEWRGPGAYVARMTPYAYVTAAMLGARFDVLATYQSRATNQTTYRSYFVVNRRAFGARQPNLNDLREYLRSLPRPRFIYHDVFSTSSFFLPALWLRDQLIFEMPSSIGPLQALKPERREGGSSVLVEDVADEKADLAAVWDGTKNAFTAESKKSIGDRVWFIPLPEQLPNDLLVCSNTFDAATKQRLVDALEKKPAIDEGDFVAWVPFDRAPDATRALSALRQAAGAPQASVVVQLHADGDIGEAARKALRLSWPEFVEYDPDFHRKYDVDWTFTPIHDGVELTTSLNDQQLKALDQHFPISYVDAKSDLTTRIVSLIHSRMHRIRYIWPYDDRAPTILGDVDFKVPIGTEVQVQRILWQGSPHTNDQSSEPPFAATVTGSDFYWLRLKPEPFKDSDFRNPLSNVAYRAVLVRADHDSALEKRGLSVLLLLLVASAIGAGWDLRRRPRTGAPPEPRSRSLDEECVALARRSHERWRRPLTELDVVWCDRRRLEEIVEDMKAQRLVPAEIGGVLRRRETSKWIAKLPFAKGGFEAAREHAVYRDETIDPAKVPIPVRLAALLQLLVDHRLLSAFAGRPLEWDALRRMLVSASGLPPSVPSGTGTVLNPGDEFVVVAASRHFGTVLEDAVEHLSLFPASWAIAPNGRDGLATAECNLEGPLEVGAHRTRVGALRLEFKVPAAAASRLSATSKLSILATIIHKELTVDNHAGSALLLRFEPIAILSEPDADGVDATK